MLLIRVCLMPRLGPWGAGSLMPFWSTYASTQCWISPGNSQGMLPRASFSLAIGLISRGSSSIAGVQVFSFYRACVCGHLDPFILLFICSIMISASKVSLNLISTSSKLRLTFLGYFFPWYLLLFFYSYDMHLRCFHYQLLWAWLERTADSRNFVILNWLLINFVHLASSSLTLLPFWWATFPLGGVCIIISRIMMIWRSVAPTFTGANKTLLNFIKIGFYLW